MSIFTAIQDWIVSVGGSPWALIAVACLSCLDGFFPPLPSESVIIALASLTSQDSGPNLWALLGLAVLGAWVGDQVAYSIGKRIPVERISFLNHGRGARAYARAGAWLMQYGPLFLIAARFVPIGRIAVNMCAGSVRYRRLTFSIVDAIACLIWASYAIGIGLGAGYVLEGHPLASMVLGIVGGLLLGVIVNQLVTLVQKWFFPASLLKAEKAADEWMAEHAKELERRRGGLAERAAQRHERARKKRRAKAAKRESAKVRRKRRRSRGR